MEIEEELYNIFPNLGNNGDPTNNTNNPQNTINDVITYTNPDENHIILDTTSKIWCMLKLNKIIYLKDNQNLDLNLVALGFSNNRILLINLNSLKIHQEIKTPKKVFSFAQLKDESNYLFSSISNGQMIIYILNQDKFEIFQILEKPTDLNRGEINKVITLSDGNLATAERGAISIWKPKIEEGLKKFEFFKEIITDYDTCQLLEVNPNVFACAIYDTKMINIYQNNGEEYPLIGSLDNVESHGNNSNGMTKINDNIFCSGGELGLIYVVSVNPVQLMQKIIFDQDEFGYIHFLHTSNDGFIFTSLGHEVIEYEIVKDVDGDFITLKKCKVFEDGKYNSAIITTDDGKIFYSQKLEFSAGKTNMFLTKYN